MRKYYLDNVRWIAIVCVVLYHVLYLYNAEGITHFAMVSNSSMPGLNMTDIVVRITDLNPQYYDMFLYIVNPWFMMILFIVSGISSRLALNKYSPGEFIRKRTAKLLVPGTVGLVAFQFIQGYVNASLAGLLSVPMPLITKVITIIFSGVGVLWFIQILWVYSMMLIPIVRIEKGRLWNFCGRFAEPKIGLAFLILMAFPVFAAAQILNLPVFVSYRIGLYFFLFMFGYFVLSHDGVVDVLKGHFNLFAVIAVVLGTAYCTVYFGQNQGIIPVYTSVLFVSYGYFASLAVIGGVAKYGDVKNGFTQWITKRSFGLYVFHYLGISAVALFIARPGYLSAPAIYLLSLIAGFGGGFILNEIISRIPYYRWAVLGIEEPKKKD